MASAMLKEQQAFLLDYCKLIEFVTNELGWICTAGELLRPIEMQEIYVKTGRSKTMDSQHIKKLAGDLNVFYPDGKIVSSYEDWSKLGHFWESLSPQNRWGGNFDKDWTKKDKFVDCPHFERRMPK